MKLPKAPLDNRTYTILLAEDDPAIARMVEMHLKASGFEVITASNGTEALLAFTQRTPHLVLSDIQMPGLSGHDLTRQIRAQGSGVPIVLITAAGTDEAEMEGFKTGADDYVEKPFNPKLLLARVVANLRRVYRYDVATSEASHSAPDSASASNSVGDAARHAAAAIAALRPADLSGHVAGREVPEGWTECTSCGYLGPQFKFEGKDNNDEKIFICPNCKNRSVTFSLG